MIVLFSDFDSSRRGEGSRTVATRRPLAKLKLLVGLFSVVLAIVPFLAISGVQAAPGINQAINFQGKLTNPNGTNVANGNYAFVFSLYSTAAGGSAIWTESDTLALTDGIFQVNLGPSAAGANANFANVDFNSDSLYLGIQVGADPEMSPRVRFTATPYAFNSERLGGKTAAEFVQLTPSAQQTGTINVSGNIQSGTSLQAPLVDTSTAVALEIGKTNASAVTLGRTGVAVTIQGNASSVITATDSGNTTTVGFRAPTAANAIFFPNAGGDVCTTVASTCNSVYQAAGTYLAKNSADTSSFAVTASNYLYGFSNSNVTPTTGGVLSLANGANTGNTLYVTASATPAAATNGLLVVNNTNAAATGNLLALQSNSANVFTVDTAGVVTYVSGTADSTTQVCRNTLGALSTCTQTSGAAFVLGGNSFSGTGGTARLGTNNADSLALETNNVIRLTVDTSGNLTLAEGANKTLSIATAAAGAGNQLSVTAGAAFSGTGGALALAGGAAAGTNQTGGAVSINGGAPTGSGSIGHLLLQTSGGKVGIGVANPDFNLHANAHADLETAILISTPSSGIGSGAGLEFKYGGGGANTNRIARIMSQLESGGGGNLLFQTAPNATGTYETKAALLRNGNFGIGTATPGALLQAGATTISAVPANTTMLASQANPYIRLTSSDTDPNYGGYIRSTYTDNAILVLGSRNAGTDTDGLTIKAGNVGIGTLDPSGASKLVVSNNANSVTSIMINNDTNGTSAAAELIVSNDTTYGSFGIGSTTYGGASTNYAGRVYVYSPTAANGITIGTEGAGDDIRFLTAGSANANERLRIQGDGNVGIGTATPDSTLHVIGGVCVESSDTGCAAATGNANVGSAVNAPMIRALAASNGTLTVQNRNFTAAGTMVSASTGTFSNSSGNAVAFAIQPTYTQTSTAAATDLLINRTETSVGSGAQLLFDAQVGGASRFSVNTSGTVTIATLGAADTSTAICRNTSNQLATCSVGGGVQFVQGGNSFTAEGNLGTNDNYALNIRTNGTTKLTVTAAGEVAFAQGANRTLNVASATTADAVGANLTVAAGAANGSTTGNTGGALALTGGAAAGSGNNNGGAVLLDGGAKTGTGTVGYVVLQGSNGGNVGIGALTPSEKLEVTGNILFSQGANRTFSVGANAANAAGNNLSVIAAAAGTGASAFSGGTLILQGGAAAGTGNANGGSVTLAGGAGVGTGTQGLVNFSTSVFSSVAEQVFSTAGVFPITAGNVDLYSTIPVRATVVGVTISVPDPAQSVVGRILYITARDTSSDITLRLNAARTPIDIAMKANSTATLIWNGANWTAAGASSSTDLQSAYNNTLTSAGGAEIILNPVGGNADGFTVRNNGTTPIVGGLLEVQTSIGTNLFSVNSIPAEWAANGGAETASTFSTNWTAVGSASAPTQTTTAGQYVTGLAGASSVFGTAAGNGIRNNMTTNPTPGDILQVSFTAKLGAGSAISDLRVDYTPTGAATGTMCTSGQSLSTTEWTKITCEVTTPGTAVTDPDLLIYQVAAAGVARTIYFDNLSITRANAADIPSNVQIGGGINGGQVTLFTLDRSSTTPVENGNTTYYGSMYYDTVTGRIQCYEADGWGACGSPPDNIISLTPEYSGAVLNGSGVGTMTADFCANETTVLVVGSLCTSGLSRQFYKWTSPQANEQTYSIYVSYKLPNTFKAFTSNSTITLTALTNNTTNGTVTYEAFKSTGSVITRCGTGETTVTTTVNTWQTVGINGNEADTVAGGGCGFAASDIVIFKINVKAKSNATVYVENLNFTYLNK